MKFIFLCALALHIWNPDFILEKSEKSAIVFQHLCKVTVENFDSVSSTRTAILCGTKITDFTLLNELRKSGLIHLFIVSGSHLLFLIMLLQQIKSPLWLINAFIFVFAMMTGFQAPLVRVVIQFYFGQILRKQNIFLRPDLVVCLSGLICLFLFPSWFQSFSFHLSWMAALALSIPLNKHYNPLTRILLQNLFITIILSVYLLQFTEVSINAWLFNIIIGTLIGPILIPLALTPIWSPFMNTIQFILTTFSPPNSFTNIRFFSSAPLLFTGCWHTLIHIYRRHFWRLRC